MASRSNKTARYAQMSAPKTPPGTDRNGNRIGPRPQVGMADPATRRVALDAALKPGPPVRSAPKPKPAVQPLPVGIGGRARERTIDEYVTKAQR